MAVLVVHGGVHPSSPERGRAALRAKSLRGRHAAGDALRRPRRHDRLGRPRREPQVIPFIDLTRQHAGIRADLLTAAARVLDSARFILGGEGEALERELAALAGVRHAIGVASGTDALRLALTAVGVRPRGEVITPPVSFLSPAPTILLVRATPLLLDIQPQAY